MSETTEVRLDGRQGAADAVRQHAEAELARLDSAWIVLSDLHIGTPPDEVAIDYVAMHPDRGIALIDLDREAATAGTAERAVHRFRELLAAERFHEFFPGHLPVAHVAVPQQPGFLLQPKIDAALAAAGTPTVEPRDWANALGDLLIGPDDGEAATATDAETATEAQPPALGEPSFMAVTPERSDDGGGHGSATHGADRPEPSIADAVRLAAERASRPASAAAVSTVRAVPPRPDDEHEDRQGLDACRPIFEPTPDTEALPPRRRGGRLLSAAAIIALVVVAGGALSIEGAHYLFPADDNAAATGDPVASAVPTAPSIILPTEPSRPASGDTETADATPPAAAAPAPAPVPARTVMEPAAVPVVSEEIAPPSPPPTVAVASPPPPPAAAPVQNEEEKRTVATAPPASPPPPAAPAVADTSSPPSGGDSQTEAASATSAAAARQPERPSAAPKAPAAERPRAPTRLVSRPPAAEPRQPERPAAAVPPPGRHSVAPRPLTPPSAATASASYRDGPPIDASDLPPLEPGAGSSSPPLQRPPYGDSALPALPPTVAQANTPVPAPPPAPPVGSVGGSAGAPSRSAATAEMTDCRPYTSATSITGQERSVEGMACRLPDGRWKLVTEAPRR
jgi:hypothetical protein